MLRNSSTKVFSWAMYDFANTIFSMNVISLYFALWVTIDMHGQDILYSVAISASMLLAAISAPILGAVSDKIQRRKPFLIGFTLLSCIFTALIGATHSLLLGLIFFAVANYGFQIGDVFYNSLLPHISNKKNIGKISGIGTSLGYIGTIVGLLLVSPFVLKHGRQAAFIPTALAFFIFALPCFFLVPDISANKFKFWLHFRPKRGVIGAAFKQIRDTFVNVKKYSNLFYFLIAVFIALNAINTVYIFMSVYVKKVAHFSDSQMIIMYIAASTCAFLGAISIGFITDYLGPKRTFTYVLLLWCVVISFAIINPYPILFWFLGPLVGICLGGTWTSARALVVALSPKHMIGEIFGFYGLVGKTATIIGPMIWGVAVWSFGFTGIIKYRIAVFCLLLFLLIGLFMLRKVDGS